MSTAADVGSETGHPKGLYVLFFAELWERFCYYGMRALLALYIADQFFRADPEAQAKASGSYGGFTALVYALGVFGGYMVNRTVSQAIGPLGDIGTSVRQVTRTVTAWLPACAAVGVHAISPLVALMVMPVGAWVSE